MRREIFTAPWVDAWARELAVSPAYRRAAADWEGSLCLIWTGAGSETERRVFLDLWHGDCRQARVAARGDAAGADFVLRASAETWQRLLDGGLDPIWALMGGKIRIERGRLSELMPHARAAKELILAARRISAEPARADSTPPAPPAATRFQTTSPRGLDSELFPMRLWQKGKRFGTWDPRSVDFARDRADWRALRPAERDVLLRLTSLFQAGEEAVAVDLLPLIQVIAAEGRLEEEIYLASFLFDEAKHVEAFRRFLDEVADERGDLSRYHTPSYRRIFYEELPSALARLRGDASPVAQAEASVTYNMIVEGVLAETGYRAYYSVLERHGILPGMLAIVGHLQADEARHLAFGVYLLSRLVAEHGAPVWDAIEARMGTLLEPALGVVDEVFASYEEMPFGLVLEEFTDFARQQFGRRMERIEMARCQSLDEILRPRLDGELGAGGDG